MSEHMGTSSVRSVTPAKSPDIRRAKPRLAKLAASPQQALGAPVSPSRPAQISRTAQPTYTGSKIKVSRCSHRGVVLVCRAALFNQEISSINSQHLQILYLPCNSIREKFLQTCLSEVFLPQCLSCYYALFNDSRGEKNPIVSNILEKRKYLCLMGQFNERSNCKLNYSVCLFISVIRQIQHKQVNQCF